MLDVKGFEQEKNEIVSFILNNIRALLNVPMLPIRDRAAYVALSLGLPIYKLFWKAYLKVQRG